MRTKNRFIVFSYTLLISYGCILEAETLNMKNNNYISWKELTYIESYIFEATAGKSDFALSLVFSGQDKINEFEEKAQSYLSRKDTALTEDETAIYQKIMLGPEFSEILYDRATKNIKKLQSDKKRINQIINDSNFSEGQLLLENLQQASKGRLPLLSNELNYQQFSTLLWLIVVDENYADQVENIYEWLKSSDPKVKKRKHYISLAEKMNSAIQDNDISTINELIDQGLDISQASYPIKAFPLETAAKNASVKTIKHILEVAPVMEIATLDGWIESIGLAIDQKRLDEVDVLVNVLAKSTWPTEEIWLPLMIRAWKTGNPSQIKSLFDSEKIAGLPLEALYKIIDEFTNRFSPFSHKYTHIDESKQNILVKFLKEASDYNTDQKGKPALYALSDENHQLLDLFLSHQNGVLQSKPDFIASSATLVQVAAYKEDVIALTLLHKHGANLAATSEYNDKNLSILGGRILYSNMKLTPKKQSVIDYLVSLDTPILMENDQIKLESFIMNYAEHRKITYEESAAFFKAELK